MPPKGRRPAHQNKKAFHANPHSVKTAKIQALPNEGLCQKCHDIIEWKKKYHKFKPLTTPRKCEICGEKTVVHAYHIICTNCARSNGICAKCRESREIVKPVVTPEERRQQKEDIEVQLMGMNLRQKRTFYRILDREHPELLSDEDDDDCCCCSKGSGKKGSCSCGHDHCHDHGHDHHDHDHDHEEHHHHHHDEHDEGAHGDDEYEESEDDDDLDLDDDDDDDDVEDGGESPDEDDGDEDEDDD